jgi:hypothetical protein
LWSRAIPINNLKNLKRVQIKKQNSGNPSEANRPEVLIALKKQNSGNPSEANRPEVLFTLKKQNSGNPSKANRPEVLLTLKKQNSGNHPEFQSSIKKQTINQTVVIVVRINLNMFLEFYF